MSKQQKLEAMIKRGVASAGRVNDRSETRIHWHDARDRAAFWYVHEAMRGQEVAETREELMRALWDAVRRADVGESVRQPERGES